MIELLRRMQMRSAAKRYASRLGGSLQQSFGPSSTYTPRQIQRGVTDCALDPNYIVFGYASFLPESEFNARLSDMPIKLPYQEARGLYSRFIRPKTTPTGGGVQGIGENSDGNPGSSGSD